MSNLICPAATISRLVLLVTTVSISACSNDSRLAADPPCNPGVSGTVCWGAKSAPLFTHQIPDTTIQIRSVR
jgi:hypothetical protein